MTKIKTFLHHLVKYRDVYFLHCKFSYSENIRILQKSLNHFRFLYIQSQLPHRRVTFSTANQAQDLQDSSQHSYYDSGLDESETPSSKSSSGPRIGPLALPEDHYERTTPDGSIGEIEHPESGRTKSPIIPFCFHTNTHITCLQTH